MVRTISTKFGLREGNMKLNVQNNDRTKIAIAIRGILILKSQIPLCDRIISA